MPREQMIRKKTVARNNTDRAAIGTGVHQSLDVQAERLDLSGIQRGLQTFGNFYENKSRIASQKKAESDELSRQQGILAQSQGTVDLERLDNDEAFRSGVNSIKGERDGLAYVEERKAELEEWRKDNPDGSYESFLEQSPTISPENMDNPEYLQAYNGITAKAMGVLGVQDSRLQAKKDDEELLNTARANFDSLVSKARLTSATPTGADIKKLHSDNLETLGLDSEESINKIVEGAIYQAGNGNHKYAELTLDFIKNNKNNMGLYGRQLRDSITDNIARQKIAASKENARSASEKFDIYNAFSDAAKEGRYDGNAVSTALDNKDITKAEAKQFRETSREFLKKMQVEANDDIRNQALMKEPLLYYRESKENQKKFDKHLSVKAQPILDGFVNIAHGLREAVTPEDKKGYELEVHNLLTDHSVYLRTMEDTGNTPENLKAFFNSTMVDSENFEAGALIYKHLEQRKLGAGLVGVSEERLSMLHSYNQLIDHQGYTPIQAKELITAKANGSLEEAKRGVLRDLGKVDFNEIIEDGIGEYLGDSVELNNVHNVWYKPDKESKVPIHVTPFIKDMLVTKAAMSYKVTGNSENAMKFAIKHIYDNFQPANGSLIPKIKQIPKEFPEAFDGLQDSFTKDLESGRIKYNGTGDTSKGFMLIPTEDTYINGKMQLRLASDPGTPLTFTKNIIDTEKNEEVTEEHILVINPITIISRYQSKLKNKKDAEQKADALEIEAESKERHEKRRKQEKLGSAISRYSRNR